MKDLQPAEKQKTRYLKFKVHSDEKIGISDLVDGFWKNAINFIGSKELSAASPWIIANKYDEETQIGIIRVNRDYVEDLRASMTLTEKFNDKKGFFEVKKTSGSIRAI